MHNTFFTVVMLPLVACATGVVGALFFEHGYLFACAVLAVFLCLMMTVYILSKRYKK